MTTPTIPAIETSYAGCHFRSRLEARWAVFFDTLGIGWQYEPQGYTVGPGHTPYLPDFWLPGLQRWVEVKGALTAADLTTLLWAASETGLPRSPHVTGSGRTLDDIPEPRILLLGNVPTPSYAPYIHWRFDQSAHGRTVLTRCFFGDTNNRTRDMQIYGPLPAMSLTDPRSRSDEFDGWLASLTHPYPDYRLRADESINRAYTAARSARFEHGESGSSR